MTLALSLVGSITGLIGLAVSIASYLSSRRTRRRQEDAALSGELYPVLRALRDHAWEYAKPLGGQKKEDLVALLYALIDLLDLSHAVESDELANQVKELLEHDVASIVLSIDPPRFEGLWLVESAMVAFDDFTRRAAEALVHCQRLRRGVV